MCCALLLYRTEHFSRGRKRRKAADKTGGRGVASKAGNKEERTRENRLAAETNTPFCDDCVMAQGKAREQDKLASFMTERSNKMIRFVPGHLAIHSNIIAYVIPKWVKASYSNCESVAVGNNHANQVATSDSGSVMNRPQSIWYLVTHASHGPQLNC